MLDTPQRRRFISPALLLAVLLCFFLPFFSVSCTSSVGQMKATVTGMDQVFGGEPEFTGFRPPPTGADTTATGEENSRISPSALIGFVAIVIGIGLGLGLPKPRARWVSGAVASGIALVAVVVNQVMIHRKAEEGLDQAESTFREQLGSTSILGQSIPVPVFELEDEPGFWVVTVLLGLVVAYNVFELVVPQRGPNPPRLAAEIAGTSQPSPFASTNGCAPGWPQGPPTRPQAVRPPNQWPGPPYAPPRPPGPPPAGYPARNWQPPRQPPSQAPGCPPRYPPSHP
jgi:hypothetical protein